MKAALWLAAACLAVGAVTVSAWAASVGTGASFKGPIGLQLYSLRDQFAKDVPGTLDKVRDMGIVYVETAGTYGMTPEAFKAELDKRGLTAISGHFPYARYKDDPAGVAKEAKALGLKYAGCAWIDHDGEKFDEATVRQAAEVFNKAGEVLAKEGIRFFYHTHGYEFRPYKDGTLFDLLMAETKPENVAYQMDVFWVAHAGEQPAKLLEKYPGRFELTHLKDMKRGTQTGLMSGHSDPANDVALGTGQIEFVPILRAAARIASLSIGKTGEPCAIGMPYCAASSRARVLCPIASIHFGDGPIKRAPASITRCANAAFSDRKP